MNTSMIVISWPSLNSTQHCGRVASNRLKTLSITICWRSRRKIWGKLLTTLTNLWPKSRKKCISSTKWKPKSSKSMPSRSINSSFRVWMIYFLWVACLIEKWISWGPKSMKMKYFLTIAHLKMRFLKKVLKYKKSPRLNQSFQIFSRMWLEINKPIKANSMFRNKLSQFKMG